MAITKVQEATQAGNYVPSITVEPGTSTTVGNTLVLIVGVNFQGAGPKETCRISSIIDDAHNEWVEGVTAAVDGPSGSPYEGTRVAIWYCAAAASASSITVTATQNVDGFCATFVEFSGITDTNPVVAAAGDSDPDDLAVQTALTVPTESQVILAAAVNGDRDLTFQLTNDAGFTSLTDCDTYLEQETVDGVLLRSAYLITSSAGTYGPTWTLSDDSSEAWCSISFREGDIDTDNPNEFWPQITHELAFGASPNDPDDVPTWTDVTNRVTEFASRRGRDYELARTEAGEANVRMRNDDGLLNPGSNPDVRVYTPYRCTAKWNGRTYPVFTGYVERWPQMWDDHYGTSPLVAVDGLATLSGTKLQGTLGSEILADNPLAYWPLEDGRLASEAANKSTQTTNTLVITPSSNGGGHGFFGAELVLQGEESTCYEQEIASLNDSNSTTGVCLRGDVDLPSFTSGGLLVEAWARIPAVSSGGSGRHFAILALKGTNFLALRIRMDASNGEIYLDVANNSNSLQNSSPGSTPSPLNDNEWHHYVAHVTASSARLWVDGELALTQSMSTTTSAISRIFVGGFEDPDLGSYNFAIGRFSHVAVFQLSNADERRIAMRANAGIKGITEKSGARVNRLLNYAGWNAGRAVDEGLSMLAPATTIAKQTLLQAVQDVASWENGLAFVDASGKFRFMDRADRFGQTEKWVFGDGEGEVPYETDVEIEYDPKYVYNDVTITKTAGKTAGGGSAHKRDQDSVKQYFMRTLDKTSGVLAVSQCEAEAEWMLENYAQPRMRLSRITICPSANPTIWPVALGTEIGDRVRVRRRPFGGDPIELECYVEQVEHHVRPGEWKTTFSLSPVLLSSYSGVDAWILGSSTLDVDAVLG